MEGIKIKKPLELTKETALELMRKAAGITDISRIWGGMYSPDRYQYRAAVGKYLLIVCENDWHDFSGLYNVRLVNITASELAMQDIQMYFRPVTLERDYDAEVKFLRQQETFERQLWVRTIGTEEAHKLVDEYGNTDHQSDSVDSAGSL